MASFGKAFLNESLGPLQRSSDRFRRNILGDGVRLLSMAELRPGLERALTAIAREASVGVSAVRAIVPMSELEQVALRIDQSQPAALANMRLNDMTIAAFGLPADAESPAVHLEVLAQHFARDRHIASSLAELAIDVADWHRLLNESARRLDADASLEQSRRRARAVRRAITVSAASVALVSLATLAWVKHRQLEEQRQREAAEAEQRRLEAEASARVEAVLASADPCVPAGLLDADQPRATMAQREALAGRAGRCADQTRRRAHEAFCGGLAARLSSRESFSPGGELDASQAAQLTRIGQRALLPTDLAIEPGALPCADHPASQALLQAFADASMGSTGAWLRVTDVSPFVARTVLEKAAVPPDARNTVAFQIEKVATGALQRPSVENLARASVLCGFKADLGLKLAVSCTSVRKHSERSATPSR